MPFVLSSDVSDLGEEPRPGTARLERVWYVHSSNGHALMAIVQKVHGKALPATVGNLTALRSRPGIVNVVEVADYAGLPTHIKQPREPRTRPGRPDRPLPPGRARAMAASAPTRPTVARTASRRRG